MKCIFAQGNPEPDYSGTRHNVGMALLDAFVAAHGGQWKPKKAFSALVADVQVGTQRVLCAKPTTYYNETGRSAQAIVHFYKLMPARDLLVVHDDLALPFGTVRIRKKGSDAGNNGIKSLNTALGPDYTRLRVGVWNELRERMNDADFVLSRFSADESTIIATSLTETALQTFNSFVDGTLEPTSHNMQQ